MVVSLDADDREWLERAAQSRRVTMTEVVREAVRRLRAEEDSARAPFDELLCRTSGLGKEGDGLAYQQASRDGWERAD